MYSIPSTLDMCVICKKELNKFIESNISIFFFSLHIKKMEQNFVYIRNDGKTFLKIYSIFHRNTKSVNKSMYNCVLIYIVLYT